MGTGGQWLMQPVETNFFDFDPAIIHWPQAAVFESLAALIGIKQSEVAVFALRREQ
jgi:hypothetical protein